MTRKTLANAKEDTTWSLEDAPSDPHAVTTVGEGGKKGKGITTISKSFSIPPSLLENLQKEAARRMLEEGVNISVSKILVEFVYKGMKK
jgi:transcriptional regulator of met regulon